MGNQQARQSSYGLDRHGIAKTGTVHWNLSVPELYEHAVRRGEGIIGGNTGHLVFSKLWIDSRMKKAMGH